MGINHFNDLKLLLNIQMICMMFIKILMITILIMIADMIHDKKLNSIVIELFIRARKLNISLAFITQSYFKVPKSVRVYTSHFFIAKIPNKQKLQQIAINHSSDINTKDLTNIYKKYTAEPYSFLLNDTTLGSDNPLRFRKNLFNIECNSLECNSII